MCGVSECDREPSIMRGPYSTRGVAPWERGSLKYDLCVFKLLDKITAEDALMIFTNSFAFVLVDKAMGNIHSVAY